MERCRAAIVLLALALAGCTGSSDTDDRRPQGADVPPGGAVLYTIGYSTDPYPTYSDARPRGFGVVSGLVAGKLNKTELRGEYGWFGGADWLDHGRILVHARRRRCAGR